MLVMRRRLARLALATGLAAIVMVGGAPQRALADSQTTCVYYTETSGSCLTQDFDLDGNLTGTRFYVFWGNWYAEL